METETIRIQPSELRIGNKLFIKGLNRYVTVTSIFKTHFRCEDVDGISFEESVRVNYLPIPLTDEIYDKCNPKRDICLRSNKSGYYVSYLSFNNDLEHYSIEKEINYLHQYQNLYFDLVGEELEINL